MKFLTLVMLGVVLLSGLAGPGKVSASFELVETLDTGVINWTRGFIYLIPESRAATKPDAGNCQNASRISATPPIPVRQQLFKLLRAVRVDQERRVADLLDTDNLLAARVLAWLDACGVSPDTNHSPDAPGRACPLYGELADLLLPPEIQSIDSIKSIPANGRQNVNATPPAPGYTGIIVDARGLRVTPMLMPVVRDENGREVYGPAFVSREHAVANGMVCYLRDLEAARNNARAGAEPLIVKALVLENPAHPDLTVSSADAARIRGNSEHLAFMKKGRVIVVTD